MAAYNVTKLPYKVNLRCDDLMNILSDFFKEYYHITFTIIFVWFVVACVEGNPAEQQRYGQIRINFRYRRYARHRRYVRRTIRRVHYVVKDLRIQLTKIVVFLIIIPIYMASGRDY